LKPNVVLFGEAVRSIAEIEFFITDCDLLLVIGTSAQVYPAAGLPETVKRNGGALFEFNLEPALSASRYMGPNSMTDYFFAGDLGVSLPMFGRAVLEGS
jgi:NAD-dependent deacetylase